MDWNDLLSPERLDAAQVDAEPHRTPFARDHDRIIFSEPFRRLANKTQVQPLYEHDHVRHRLIHSIEVATVGRSLATAIALELTDETTSGKNLRKNLPDIVQAACAAHDIGNPPFGHSGEKSIGAWFESYFAERAGPLADVDESVKSELRKFEGNAQGFRIAVKIERHRGMPGMNLTKAVLGAYMKYPHTANTMEDLNAAGYAEPGYFGQRKFGIFRSERDLYSQVAETLGLEAVIHDGHTWWRRHPLVFIVEAADDICYSIADLEDAFTTGELPFESVRSRLHDIAAPETDDSGIDENEQIKTLRSLCIGRSVQSCCQAFCENVEGICDGTYGKPLVEWKDLRESYEAIDNLSQSEIYFAQRKTGLEISGRTAIKNVLDGILPVYEEIVKSGGDGKKRTDHTKQVINALSLDVNDMHAAAKEAGIDVEEEALHRMADFVSGMTDRYALRVSRMLSGT